jgi:uracil-DNA glycosylase
MAGKSNEGGRSEIKLGIKNLKKLLEEIKLCQVCQPFFSHPCNPMLIAHPNARICIIGQAPGRKVQESGIAWADKSGENLMQWLGLNPAEFYDENLVALIPIGFCYPGTGKSGDLPPRKECAPLWHDRVLNHMKYLQLTLLIGKYAQNYYLKNKSENLTSTVRNFETFLPTYFPLPHPSPRNNIWKKKNPWFEQDVLPRLRTIIR